MVLIISDEKDFATHEVMEWFSTNEIKCVRINCEDLVENMCISDNEIQIKIMNTYLNFDDFSSVWYRTGFFQYRKLQDIDTFPTEQKNHLIEEWRDTCEYLFYKLKKKKGIINPCCKLNKLVVLDKAKATGLLIPTFMITDYKPSFLRKKIMKPIGNGFNMFVDQTYSTLYTEKADILEYDEFFATFFQEKIDPVYEIRSIFLKNKCWSMAIHNPSKDVDYRKNYNNLRYSPYKLPQEIENKTFTLLKELNMEYGAVDFIVDKQRNHFFLEINPFGQFSMVSLPCNYFIEKEIAYMLQYS